MRRAAALFLVGLLGLAACTPGRRPPPRDTGKVVPVKQVSVAGQLYAVKGRTLYRFSGTQMTAVTHDVRVQDPAVTLDGDRLAYVQLERDRSSIVVTDPALRERRSIDPAGAGAGALWSFAPAFSPDGRTLAFLTDRGKQEAADLAVWRYDLVRQSFRRLTVPSRFSGGDADPAWRPGHEGQLVYTHHAYGGAPPAPEARLTWMSVASGRSIFLSPPAGRIMQPAWSPDGRFVAFVRAGAGTDELFVMAVAASYDREPQPYPTEAATLVQSGVVAQPIWSPDGNALAFLMLNSGSFDLYIVPLSTDGVARTTGPATAVTRASFFDADSRLAWAP